jgi:hypothetical protein
MLIALAAAGCLFIVGLNQACTALLPEPDVDELHAYAQSLLPTGAEVIQSEDSVCTMFSSPDCTTVAFYREGSRPNRERLVEERAEQAGWACSPMARLPGGSSLECERDGYHASIHLSPKPESSCHGRPLNDCDPVDTIRVTAPRQ